jgi:spoIIIJ-associated protein
MSGGERTSGPADDEVEVSALDNDAVAADLHARHLDDDPVADRDGEEFEDDDEDGADEGDEDDSDGNRADEDEELEDDEDDEDLEDEEDDEDLEDEEDPDAERLDDEGPDVAEDEEPEFATVATGADVEEAKRTALAQLRKIVPWVTEADVEYEVVEEGARGGFFGRGRKGAEVEARVRSSAKPADEGLEPLAEDLREFLDGVIDRMGLDAHIDVRDEGDAAIADMSGPDLGILIGRHGQTIDALQYLCAIAVNRRHRSRRRVIVDAEGYRDRRASSLHAMADRVAQRVAREREPIMLKPMSAAERKVIHLRLKDNPKVETSSEGQEPNRAVVIAPRSQ